MKHQAQIRKLHSVQLTFYGMTIFCLLMLSCVKKNPEPVPVPVWEDNSADSARLNIRVQTAQGLLLTAGTSIKLALSPDSLTQSLLVRLSSTNAAGVAVFRKLYPRKLYYNCIAITNVQTFYGSGWARLSPGLTTDTTLIVR